MRVVLAQPCGFCAGVVRAIESVERSIEKYGPPGYRPEWFDDLETVRLTAGASAPEELVDDVIDALRRLGSVQTWTMEGPREAAFFLLPRELIDP